MAKRMHNAAPATAPQTPVEESAVILANKDKRWLAGSVIGVDTILPGKASLGRINQSDVITVLVDTNPKRRASALAFAHYSTGMTVAEFCKAVGKGGLGHVAWDVNHGFIRLTAADVVEVEETVDEEIAA